LHCFQEKVKKSRAAAFLLSALATRRVRLHTTNAPAYVLLLLFEFYGHSQLPSPVSLPSFRAVLSTRNYKR
jgi:hypothetical protein